jgi:hypothetical protein
MTNYEKGRRLEYDVQHDLEENGYLTFRSASSKGIADVIGIKRAQVALIQAKTNGAISPGDRAELLSLADMVPGGFAVVAQRPRTTYRRLTGGGPQEFEKWTPEEFVMWADDEMIKVGMKRGVTEAQVETLVRALVMTYPTASAWATAKPRDIVEGILWACGFEPIP